MMNTSIKIVCLRFSATFKPIEPCNRIAQSAGTVEYTDYFSAELFDIELFLTFNCMQTRKYTCTKLYCLK